MIWYIVMAVICMLIWVAIGYLVRQIFNRVSEGRVGWAKSSGSSGPTKPGT